MENSDENYREYKLDNGLVVALQSTPTQTIFGQLRFHYGGVHEKQDEEGLAHFLEHNIINGGSERYTPEEIKKIRAKFPVSNAFTSQSHTCYIAGIFPEDLERFLDFSSQIAFHPRLDKKVIDIERQRVLREISDKKSKPEFSDTMRFINALYRNNFHTYFVLGNEETVSNANQETLKKFHSKGYSPDNADLILAGKLPANAEELIAKYFSDKQSEKNKRFCFPSVSPLEKRVAMHSPAPDLINKDNLNESNSEIDIGFIVPPLGNEGTYATALLNLILGRSTNSRLFKEISEKRGLAYSIGSKYAGKNNAGAILINGNIHSTRQSEAIGAIFNQIKKLGEESISEDELLDSKNRLRYGAAIEFETNGSIVNSVVEFKLDYGMTKEEYLTNMAKVTVKDVREIAQRYLPKNREDENYVLLIRDPLKE